MVAYDDGKKNYVYQVLVDKLNEYFTPKRNSAFERHLFRNINPLEGESFNKFVLRLRQQYPSAHLVIQRPRSRRFA